MGLETRLRLARLYLCTDARERQGDLEDFLHAAFSGGVDIIQIRQKGMAPEQELEVLGRAREVAFNYQGLVCVNDSAELAGRFSADLLHLGQTDGGARAARRHLHRWALIGRSTHSRQQADQAVEDDDVNYFCVGPVYATATKPDYPPVGLDLVRYATEVQPPWDVASKPWFAIGGVNADNLDDVLAAGAKRICVVRPITEASDPAAAAAALKARLREAWNADQRMERYTFAALARG
ncbi:thiamine phosphate synthase [Microlunatus panaciterrae]|nr:thiamine phosphate synthase [Microlunatus panaciterrae]